MHKLKDDQNALWQRIMASTQGERAYLCSLGVFKCVCTTLLFLLCIRGIGLVSLCIVLTIIKKGENVSAPVHPLVLIIVKTHENKVEHILAMLQMT